MLMVPLFCGCVGTPSQIEKEWEQYRAERHERLQRDQELDRIADEARLAVQKKYIEDHPELSEVFKEAILKGSAVIGMSTNDVHVSMGEPERKNVSVYKFGVREQWAYGNTYLYFDDGKLTSWSQRR